MKPIKKELDRLVQEASRGKRCRICGKPAVCFHHVVRRDDDMCRYDPVNLMPVCQSCHNEIHAGHINEKQYLTDEENEFLNELKKMSYKDFLIFVAQQTETEYLKGLKKKMGRKNIKDSIKNNPEKEVDLGFVGNFPLSWKNDGTKFDEFVENCYKHGLIDDNTRMFLEYYSAEEKNLCTSD